jgi:hypothetical protein
MGSYSVTIFRVRIVLEAQLLGGGYYINAIGIAGLQAQVLQVWLRRIELWALGGEK